MATDEQELAEADEQELAEANIEFHHPKAPPELRHKAVKLKEGYTVYQQTGVTDPNNATRYKKKFNQKVYKLTQHTVKVKKGYLLRRSGVAIRYEHKGKNEAAALSFSTNQAIHENVAEKEAGGLPIGRTRHRRKMNDGIGPNAQRRRR